MKPVHPAGQWVMRLLYLPVWLLIGILSATGTAMLSVSSLLDAWAEQKTGG